MALENVSVNVEVNACW